MLAMVYLLPWLCCGWFMARCLLPGHRPLNRLWIGASLGLLCMMWLPALFAFAVKFTVTAHLLAYGALTLLTLGCCLLRDRRTKAAAWDREETRQLWVTLAVALPLTAFFAWLQYTHVYRVGPDGGLYVGQATYGDLPMHTAFITGLKNAAFPPEYTMFPGHRLTYPFLTDSLSTTFYLFGMSLQAAVIVPAVLMFLLTCTGVMIFGRELTRGKGALVLAALLFFINGGLGFLYHFDLAGGIGPEGVPELADRMDNILREFYHTPTNQPDPYNLRWSNIIADLFVPQRTLLGGYCMALPCFYLLWTGFGRGREGVRWHPVILLAVWAGALPLVHTHSFLALGLCSLGLMLYDLTRGKKLPALPCLITVGAAAVLLAVSLLWVPVLRLPAGLALAAVLLGLLVWALILDRERWVLLRRYLVYAGIAVLIALPQLAAFTFHQALGHGKDAAGSFLRFHFNWVNGLDGAGLKDLYFWFYLKNIGIPFFLVLMAALEKDAGHRRALCGAGMIWLAAELVQFQPNDYDNNKLFYLAWLLCCFVVGDYCAALFKRLKGFRGRWLLAAACAVVFFLSGALSLAREAVSDYWVFSRQEVEMADWLRENTDEDSVFVTSFDEHLNPVDSLAGRKIVCGPDLWLHWHGFDTSAAKWDLIRFYTDPAGNPDVPGKYGADYVVFSWRWQGQITGHDLDPAVVGHPVYRVDVEALYDLYEPVWEDGWYTIFAVPEG